MVNWYNCIPNFQFSIPNFQPACHALQGNSGQVNFQLLNFQIELIIDNYQDK